MDWNSFMAIVLIAYGLYLGWCRWLDYRTAVATKRDYHVAGRD